MYNHYVIRLLLSLSILILKKSLRHIFVRTVLRRQRYWSLRAFYVPLHKTGQLVFSCCHVDNLEFLYLRTMKVSGHVNQDAAAAAARDGGDDDDDDDDDDDAGFNC
jgi:hypothetical protein